MELDSTPMRNIALPVLKQPHEYHAFIAYCKDDLAFSKSLLKTLEKYGFKCLFADRDFMAGQHITENIAEAVEKSRRVVMILSKSSAKSTWLSFEMMVSLEKTYEKNRLVLITLLVDVDEKDLPQMLKSVTYINKCDDDWLMKLLRDLSGPDVSVDTMLPAGNVAHGLAWSFFYGYLKLVLPESCMCHPCLSDADTNIEFHGIVEAVTLNRGGNHQRVYRNSIYKVTSDENQVYYVVCEYASVILAMYEMEVGKIAGLTPDGRKLQIVRFYETLLSILSHGHASECHGTFKLIFYPDNPGAEQYVKLSDLLIREIKTDLDQTDG